LAAFNPYYSFEYLITDCLVYYTLGQYAKAAAVLEQAQTRNANNVVVEYLLSASYVRLGRLDDAQWVADELQLLTATARLANVERNFPLANNDAKKALLTDLSSADLRHQHTVSIAFIRRCFFVGFPTGFDGVFPGAAAHTRRTSRAPREAS